MSTREGEGPPALVRRGAELLFGLGAAVFHRLADHGLLAAASLPVPVVSIGNVEVGGTGKTPAVLAIGRAACATGWNPAVLTRGYGGSRGGILKNGGWEGGAPAHAGECGDEPLLLSRTLPEVPVVVGKDRAGGARALLARSPHIDLFLLDDGFQHRRLVRDRDLVLLDAGHPFGNGRLLPAGPLREAPAALARADHLLLVVDGKDEEVPEATVRLLAEHAPGVETSRAWTEATGHRPLSGGTAQVSPGAPVLAVAGIARPERFRESLAAQGWIVRGWRRFPDHHRFRPAEVAILEAQAAREGVILFTTAKDAVRLEGLVDPAAPWFVLDIELRSELGWESFLREEVPSRRL